MSMSKLDLHISACEVAQASKELCETYPEMIENV